MKKSLMNGALFLITLLLGGCSPQFPVLKSARISPVDIGITDTLHFVDIALSPDGQTIVKAHVRLVNLETGEECEPFRNYEGFPIRNLMLDIGGWSSEWRYLGVTDRDYDMKTRTTLFVNRVIDTQTQSVYVVPGQVFWSWSPFNTGTYLTRQDGDVGVLGVYNIHEPEDKFVPLDGMQQYDFTQERDVAGSGDLLWSKRVDLPIAELAPLKTGAATNMAWRNLVIRSYYDFAIPGERQYQLTLIDDPAAHIVGAIFDPTGEYVLVAEWECPYTDTAHCSDLQVPPVLDGITDSLLTLIQWRTSQRKVLLRLSEIDSQGVIASGDLYWSADGSTILVGRINAPFIVLKVGYP